MKQHDPDKDISFFKTKLYEEIANETFDALVPFMRNPEKNKEAILTLLKWDYDLIHLLTKRYTLK